MLELSMELLGIMTSTDLSASGEIGCPDFFAYLKLQGALRKRDKETERHKEEMPPLICFSTTLASPKKD